MTYCNKPCCSRCLTIDTILEWLILQVRWLLDFHPSQCVGQLRVLQSLGVGRPQKSPAKNSNTKSQSIFTVSIWFESSSVFIHMKQVLKYASITIHYHTGQLGHSSFTQNQSASTLVATRDREITSLTIRGVVLQSKELY